MCILPFSTWAIFFSVLFFAEAGVSELGYSNTIETFYHIIPYIFYAIAAVIIVPLFALGAVVSGATLSSPACFYSNATVLTSSYCNMENMNHALSQFPYAMLAAGISVAGYLACGFLL